jgi:hypothetical protein
MHSDLALIPSQRISRSVESETQFERVVDLTECRVVETAGHRMDSRLDRDDSNLIKPDGGVLKGEFDALTSTSKG